MAEPDNRDSMYHSMQLKVVKRFSAGAQPPASHTVAKLIDNTNCSPAAAAPAGTITPITSVASVA
jgi:hypothetical protein